MPKWIRDNGLTIALMLMFAMSLIGQALTGLPVLNEERLIDGLPAIEGIWTYVGSSHFLSALFENWESEFLQMAIFVLLTVWLFQRGSSESKPLPDEEQEPDKFTHIRYFRDHHWLRKIYENSLFGALMLLFFVSFVLHGFESMKKINDENLQLGKATISFIGIFAESEFWFESFQNWQSEFFSVAMLGVLSIFLRQKDSPQSKEVDAPHFKTGD